MAKLWQKSESDTLNAAIETFEVGEDYLLDRKLVEYDIYGSLAHGKMLAYIGILTEEEYVAIKSELLNILEDSRNGNFEITVQDEDVHSKIENRLTTKLSEVGKKIHTARSRNDQVLVDTRLYSKDQLLSLKVNLISLIEKIIYFSKKYEWIPMPGYTHMQLAMPSSIGMWGGAFAEALIDEIPFIDYVYTLNDQSPLGSGAGYGVSIPIDREMTCQLLGFKRLQQNALYCGNSRGKIESNIISAIVSIALVLNKIASDLLLFTTKEFDFFQVPTEITTGSSIMPQKKNLDIMELIRGKVATLLGLEISIKSLISNLPSGYNRDFQDTKKFLMTAFETISPMLPIMELTIDQLKPNKDKLLAAHKPEIYATNIAYKMVMEENIPFRDAYRMVGKKLDDIEKLDPEKIIVDNKVIGSTGNLRLDIYLTMIENAKIAVKKEQDHFKQQINRLIS